MRDGVTFTLDDLKLDEGDEQQVEIDSKGISMENGSEHEIDPTLGYGDLTGGDGYEVTLRTSGVDEEATLELTAKPGQRRLKVDFEAGGDEDARVTTVVKRIDEEGDVKTGTARTTALDDGKAGTVSYSDKAIRDGKLEMKVKNAAPPAA